MSIDWLAVCQEVALVGNPWDKFVTITRRQAAWTGLENDLSCLPPTMAGGQVLGGAW
jgi:hypothetical protein